MTDQTDDTRTESNASAEAPAPTTETNAEQVAPPPAEPVKVRVDPDATPEQMAAAVQEGVAKAEALGATHLHLEGPDDIIPLEEARKFGRPDEPPAEAAADAPATAQPDISPAPEAPPPASPPRKLYRWAVPVPQDDKTRLAISDEMAQVIGEIQEVEAEKKAEADRLGKKLKALEARLVSLKDRYNATTMSVEVDCYDERDVFAKKIRIRRADTDAIVQERDMTPVETQLQLDEARKRAEVEGREPAEVISLAEAAAAQTAATDDQTEEQRFAETPEEAEAMREKRIDDERRQRAADLANTARMWKGTKNWRAYLDDFDGGEIYGEGEDEDAAAKDLEARVYERLCASAGKEAATEPQPELPIERAPRALLKRPQMPARAPEEKTAGAGDVIDAGEPEDFEDDGDDDDGDGESEDEDVTAGPSDDDDDLAF